MSRIFYLRSLFFALLIVFFCGSLAFGETAPLTITFFSVGKADSILIRQGSSVMLIDTATSHDAPYVISRLKEESVSSIDVLVVTHMDQDHVGGAGQILRSFPVKSVYQPNHKKNSLYYKDYVKAMEEKSIKPTIMTTNDTSFAFASCDVVMYAPGAVKGMVPNDYSLMTSLFFGNTSVLFTGDATPLRIDKFFEHEIPHYDVLKVPHHGMVRTNNSNFSALLRKATPKYAVITDSLRDNLRAKVSLLMELLGIEQIFMTDKGDVELTSDGTSIEMKSLGKR